MKITKGKVEIKDYTWNISKIEDRSFQISLNFEKPERIAVGYVRFYSLIEFRSKNNWLYGSNLLSIIQIWPVKPIFWVSYHSRNSSLTSQVNILYIITT